MIKLQILLLYYSSLFILIQFSSTQSSNLQSYIFIIHSIHYYHDSSKYPCTIKLILMTIKVMIIQVTHITVVMLLKLYTCILWLAYLWMVIKQLIPLMTNVANASISKIYDTIVEYVDTLKWPCRCSGVPRPGSSESTPEELSLKLRIIPNAVKNREVANLMKVRVVLSSWRTSRGSEVDTFITKLLCLIHIQMCIRDSLYPSC